MMKKAVTPFVPPSYEYNIAMKLIQVYLPSRLASVKAFAQSDLPEDPLEDDKRIQIDLESLLYLSCAEFDKISKYVLQFFDPILQKYKDAANWEVADAMLKDLYVYEGQLTWLIHLMGMLVEGQLYLTRCIDSLFNGQWDLYPIGAGDVNPLIMRVAELFQVCNRGVPSQRGEECSKQRLDAVIQSFLDKFQPVLFGDGDGMSTPVQDLRAKFLECGIDLKSSKMTESPEKAEKKKNHWANLLKLSKKKKSKKILEERVMEEEMEKERVSSELALAQAECSIHQRQVERLVCDLQSLKRERTLWEESLESMTMDIESLKERLEEKEKEFASMEGELAKRRMEDQSIHTEMEEVKARLNSKQREFMDMVELWRKSEDDVKRLEVEIEKTKEMVDQKEREVEELVAELWVCEEEKQKLASKVEEIKTMLDEKEQAVEDVEAKLADCENERLKVAHQIEDVSAKLNSREEEMTKLVSVLRKGEEERKRWRDRAEKGEEGVEKLQKKLEQMVRESEWGDVAKEEQAKAEMEQLRGWLDEREKEVEEVKEELDRVKEQRESWKDEARKMNQEAMDLRLSLDEWEREKQVREWKRRQEEDEKNAELATFRRWLEKKESEVKGLRAKMEKAGLEKLRERVKKVEEEMHQMKQVIGKIEGERGIGAEVTEGSPPPSPTSSLSSDERGGELSAEPVMKEEGTDELDWELRIERVEGEVHRLRERLEELLACVQKVDERRTEEDLRRAIEMEELRENLKKKESEITESGERMRTMEFERRGWSEKVLMLKEQVDDMRKALSSTWATLSSSQTQDAEESLPKLTEKDDGKDGGKESPRQWELKETDLWMFDEEGTIHKWDESAPSSESPIKEPNKIAEEEISAQSMQGSVEDASNADSILIQAVEALRTLRVDVAHLEEKLLSSTSEMIAAKKEAANLEASLKSVRSDSDKWKQELQLREEECMEMSEQLDRKEGELREMAGGLEKVMESERGLRSRAEGAEELVAVLRERESRREIEIAMERDKQEVNKALSGSTTRTMRLDMERLKRTASIVKEDLCMAKEEMRGEEGEVIATECASVDATVSKAGMPCECKTIRWNIERLRDATSTAKRDLSFARSGMSGMNGTSNQSHDDDAAAAAEASPGADPCNDVISSIDVYWLKRDLEFLKRERIAWCDEAAMHAVGADQSQAQMLRCQKELVIVEQQKLEWYTEAIMRREELEKIGMKLMEVEKELARKEKEVERVGREKQAWCEEATRKASDAEEVGNKWRESQSKLDDLRKQFARAEDEKEWMMERIRREATERRRVERELDEARVDIGSLRQDVKELREKLADSLLRLAKAKGQSRAYEWRAQVLESEVMGTKGELERAKAQAGEMEEKVARLRDEVRQRDFEKENLREKVHRREVYNTLLKCELKFLLAKREAKQSESDLNTEEEAPHSLTITEFKEPQQCQDAKKADTDIRGIAQNFLEEVQFQSCERTERIQNVWFAFSEKGRRRRTNLLMSMKKARDCRLMLNESCKEMLTQGATVAAA